MDKQDEIIKKLDEIHARLDQIEGEIKLLGSSKTWYSVKSKPLNAGPRANKSVGYACNHAKFVPPYKPDPYGGRYK